MKHRVIQYLAIILVLSGIAGGYFYFSSNAAQKINASKTNNLTSGLVGYWTFDGADMTATYATDKAGSNNMTLNSTTKNIGKIGQALTFNGTSDYINAAAGIINGTDTMTVSAWVKRTGAGSGDGGIYEGIFQEGYAGGVHLVSSCNGNNLLQFGFRSGGITYSATTSNSIIADASWHQVSGVYDGDSNKIYLYVDGIEQSNSDADVDMVDVINQMRIGGTSASGQSCDGSDSSAYFKGSIDEVRVYNRALSPSEITELYQQGQTKINASQTNKLTSGLVGHWTFDGADTFWSNSTSGTMIDNGSGGNNGSFASLSQSSTPTIGKIGQAFDFDDGSSDYVEFGTPSIGATSYTMCSWIYPKIISGSLNIIQYIDKPAAIVDNLLFRVTNSGSLQVADGNTNLVSSSALLLANNWYHACFTASNLTANGSIDDIFNIYINGSPGTPATSSYNPDSGCSSGLIVGARYNCTAMQFFRGKIDEVRIYNRVLSDSEITELYQQGQTKINASQTGKLTSGLTGYWTMDGQDTTWTTSTSGTIVNKGSTGGNGAITDMSQTVSPVIGRVGQALNFDGTDDYVDTTGIFNFITNNEGTISAWVKPHGAVESNADVYNLPGIFGGTSGCTGVHIGNDTVGPAGKTGDKIWVYNWDGDNDQVGASYNNDEWTHITWMHTSGNLYVYKNGTLVDETSSGSTACPGNFRIGKSYTAEGGKPFNGDIDEVRIYNRALSPSEVTELYNLGR